MPRDKFRESSGNSTSLTTDDKFNRLRGRFEFEKATHNSASSFIENFPSKCNCEKCLGCITLVDRRIDYLPEEIIDDSRRKDPPRYKNELLGQKDSAIELLKEDKDELHMKPGVDGQENSKELTYSTSNSNNEGQKPKFYHLLSSTPFTKKKIEYTLKYIRDRIRVDRRLLESANAVSSALMLNSKARVKLMDKIFWISSKLNHEMQAEREHMELLDEEWHISDEALASESLTKGDNFYSLDGGIHRHKDKKVYNSPKGVSSVIQFQKRNSYEGFSNEDSLGNSSDTSICNGQLYLKVISVKGMHCSDINKAKLGHVYVIFVDGIERFRSDISENMEWDEVFTLCISHNCVIDICIVGSDGILYGFIWIYARDLIEYLSYIKESVYSRSSDSLKKKSLVLDMIPIARLEAIFDFKEDSKLPMEPVKPALSPLDRLNVVSTKFPKFLHIYIPKPISRTMLCSICRKKISKLVYVCENCNNGIHPGCYNNVISLCLNTPRSSMRYTLDSGGVLKNYNIHHVFNNITNIFPSFCNHCGILIYPGKKIVSCKECCDRYHKDCYLLVANYCGLTAETAQAIMKALEDKEQLDFLNVVEKSEIIKGEKTLHRTDERWLNDMYKSLALVPMDKRREVTNIQEKIPPKCKQKKGPKLIRKPVYPSSIDDSDHKLDAEPRENKKSKIKNRVNRHVVKFIADKVSNARSVVKSVKFPKRRLVKSLTSDNIPITRSENLGRLPEFSFISVIGKGAFGTVVLARHNATKKLHAIKILRKRLVLQRGEVKSVNAEKRIFRFTTDSDFPYLVKLDSSFQTSSHLFFVMEFVNGGDLMTHIIQKKRFSYSRVKFYACEILLILEYLHSKNIIYRDLKLDNVLLTSDGHVKIADYGVCKENVPYGKKTRTFCGTPDYMAPEILMGNPYDRSVDWWSYGILLYVMTAGGYPFKASADGGILKSILSDTVEYSSLFSTTLKSLIQNLLEINPARRIGNGPQGAQVLKSHAYFADVDWESFYKGTAVPPWKPKFTNSTDLSNFDPEFTSRNPDTVLTVDQIDQDKQAEFSGFTCFFGERYHGTNDNNEENTRT